MTESFYPKHLVCIDWRVDRIQHLGEIYCSTHGKRLRKMGFILCGSENLQVGRFVFQEGSIVQYLDGDESRTPCYDFKFEKVEKLFWSEDLNEDLYHTIRRVLEDYNLPRWTLRQNIPQDFSINHLLAENPILTYLQSQEADPERAILDNLLKKLAHLVETCREKNVANIQDLKHQCYVMNGIFSIDIVLTRDNAPRRENFLSTLGSYFGSFHAGLNIDMTYLHINGKGEYLFEDLWYIPHEEVDRNQILIQIPALIYEPEADWYEDLLTHIRQVEGQKDLLQIAQHFVDCFRDYLPRLSDLSDVLKKKWQYSQYDHCQDFVQSAFKALGLANCNLTALHGFPKKLASLINQLRVDSTQAEATLEQDIDENSESSIAFKIVQSRFRLFKATRANDMERVAILKDRYVELLKDFVRIHGQQFKSSYLSYKSIYQHKKTHVVPTYYPVFVPMKKVAQKPCIVS